MKQRTIILVAVNAKYVQTNPAIRMLKYYAEEQSDIASVFDIQLGEWNINMEPHSVLRDISNRIDLAVNGAAVFFSVYIWNRLQVFRLATELRLLYPNLCIGMGGPEVSFTAPDVFSACSAVDLIMTGEGEATFCELLERWQSVSDFSRTALLATVRALPGTYVRTLDDSGFAFGGMRPVITNLETLPFIYAPSRLDFDPCEKIVYYESSRGCPFSCAYCLSSTDTGVRFYPINRICAELTYFMDAEFPLIKFTDRTFNIRPSHYLAIWNHIAEYYRDSAHRNKKLTRFHFEIAAEQLSDESIVALARMPAGSVQLEIGIQSSHQPSLVAVDRPCDTEALKQKIQAIPDSIHRHVDLIAGLPYENVSDAGKSFNYAFNLHTDMLQLGFLKILPGTKMQTIASRFDAYAWSPYPPYEVLRTPWMSFDDLAFFKDVAYILDSYYNSGLLKKTFDALATATDAFDVFTAAVQHLAHFFCGQPVQHPRKPYDLFTWAADFCRYRNCSDALQWLKYDYYMQGKESVVPKWMERNTAKEKHYAAAFRWFSEKKHVNDHPVSARTLYGKTEYEVLSLATGDMQVLFVYDEKPYVAIPLIDND